MIPARDADDETDDRLTDLVMAWEESKAAGIDLSPAEVCRESPELVDQFARAIARLNAFDQFLFSNRASPDSIEINVGDAPDQFPNIPGYQILGEIGRGGMGIVYKARQQSLNRIVAIKSLPGGRWSKAGFIARLRQEAKGMSQLDHPRVVKVFDIVETPAAVSMIMEYVEGESLANRLKRMAMQPKEAAELAQSLASALAFVHQNGLLHRDIKPANVLIDSTGSIKIADFGLVKDEESPADLTLTGEFFGTPCYMAPEQAAGRHANIDVRTDVYGVGATLYEMLSGRPPFVGVSTLDTLELVQHREPVPLRILSQEIPRDLETICLKCLEKEPARRFSNAHELADDIDRFLRGLPIRSRPIGSFERYRRWCRRRPAIASLTALIFTAVITIAILLVSHNRNLTTYNRDLTRLNIDLKRLNDDLDTAAMRATELQRLAELHERQARDALYVADINRAATALRQKDTRETSILLGRHLPEPGEVDRRGFEWWYLHRQANRTGTSLLEVGSPQYLLVPLTGHRHMAVAGADAIVRILNLDTGTVSQQIETGQIEINGVAFAPDGKEMATAGDDGTIRIWNLKTGLERLKLKAHPGKAFQLLYTPDGSQIISCGANPMIRVFDSRSGDELFKLEGHRSDVQSLLLTNDGQTLISSSNDHHVRVWNLTERKTIGEFESSSEVGPIAYRAEGNLLFIGNGKGYLQTIRLKDNREVANAKHLDRISALAVHPNGSLVAAGDSSGQIRLRHIDRDGRFVDDSLQPWHAHTGVVYSLTWSADASHLISTGVDGRVVSWDLAAVQNDAISDFSLSISNSFCLLPKTRSLLGRSSDGLCLWDWNVGTKRVLSPSPFLVFPAAAPDGRLIAAVLNPDFQKTGHLQVFGAPTPSRLAIEDQLLGTWQPGGELQNIRFSHDSKSIAVSRWFQQNPNEVEDHTVWLLDISGLNRPGSTRNGVPVSIDRAERIPVLFAKDCAFSPDGKYLLLIAREGLFQWDIAERRIAWEVPIHYVESASYSPDGALIATSGDDRQVQIFDSADGSIRHQLATHRAGVHSNAFSPDGQLLASGASDGAIKLWHVATGQELLEFPTPPGDVRHIEFSDDGAYLICQVVLKDPPGLVEILILDGSPIPAVGRDPSSYR